ncbi:MAG: GYDIA family GHMP kinase [Bacteroidota bacterium]|nr:GYDIA family GHMP kinase [Bacteroidota bacterium]
MALALPTKLGQRMKVQELSGSEILWCSVDSNGKKWFDAEIDLIKLEVIKSSDEKVGNYLRNLFKACCQNNSEFLSHWKKYKIENYLEFPREWGLGSSSTLIYNMAMWADVNPYHLYFDVEIGSGYDIACASAEGPILYTLGDGSLNLEEVDFKPPFADNLFFLPLNHKTASNEAVLQVKDKKPDKKTLQKAVDFTEKVLEIKTISAFESWMSDHEKFIAHYVNLKPVQEERFPDYWGKVKSLGAWGGDMVLVSSTKTVSETAAYFSEKGYGKLIPYKELIL